MPIHQTALVCFLRMAMLSKPSANEFCRSCVLCIGGEERVWCANGSHCRSTSVCYRRRAANGTWEDVQKRHRYCKQIRRDDVGLTAKCKTYRHIDHRHWSATRQRKKESSYLRAIRDWLATLFWVYMRSKLSIKHKALCLLVARLTRRSQIRRQARKKALLMIMSLVDHGTRRGCCTFFAINSISTVASRVVLWPRRR